MTNTLTLDSGRRIWGIPVFTCICGRTLHVVVFARLSGATSNPCWANLWTVVRYENGSYTSRGRAIKKNRLWQWRSQEEWTKGRFIFVHFLLFVVHKHRFFLLPPWEKKQGVKRWGALLIRKPSLTWCHHRTRVQNVQIGLFPKNVE